MKSLRILVYLHMTCPAHQAGSETTLHAAMREMVRRGHDVTVMADQLTIERIDELDQSPPAGFTRTGKGSYEYEGVKVISLPQNHTQYALVQERAKDADLVVTHLDCTNRAMQLCLDIEKPLVHFIHNTFSIGTYRVTPYKCQLAIFNSEWVRNAQRYTDPILRVDIPWPGESIVIHPIVEPEQYRTERGNKILFSNPTDGKGVGTVHKVAESLPGYEFLVVEGIYGEQIAPPNLGEEWERAHPNIQHIKTDPHFVNVLRQTKVVLMPSEYETYGRVAVEAACAGIPSIVHPTEGLLEALGAEVPDWVLSFTRARLRGEAVETPEQLKGGWVSGAGIFCDRNDIDSWTAQIDRLYTDEVYYRSRSDAALKLANSFNPQSEFDRLEQSLLICTEKWARRNEVDMPKMWTSDRRLWETSDGRLIAEIDGRIPQNAIRMAAGIGTEIPEEVAIRNGIIPDPEAKAIAAPAENKALEQAEDKDVKPEKKERKKKVA